MGGMPSGVVSFVLADVVGSTELWERAPEVMAVARTRHEALVTAAVESEGGTLLKARGDGTSTLSVFTRATDALRAAHRMQVAVRAEEWPAPAVMCTRVAVDTGEAVERDGDYFGPAVNRVGGLRGAAHCGEVVVSVATAAVVSGSLPAGWALVDAGTVELRGLGLQATFVLSAPDLDPIQRQRPTPVGGVSRREAEVLDLVVDSRTNAEIAAALFISERTVESHVSSLLRKLEASDRRDLVRRARTRPSPVAPLSAPLLPPALELLAGATGFVGRVAERELLRERWRVASAGHTLLVVVAAEAGMGKSRLVAELAADVHRDGGRVLFGACFEDVEQPYGPFAQAIADGVGGTSPDLPIELARLLPGAATPVAPHADHLAAPGAVSDGIRHWLTTAAASAPTLLVIEDLHWSTATTRDVVRQLVRTAGRARLLVVATTRDTAPDLDHDLATLLADLERSPAVTRLELSGLGHDEVAALMGMAAHDVDAVVADTGGNPLLVTHVTAGDHAGSLAALLARRDALLDERGRDLLDLAATFGAEFDADLLATASVLTLLDVLEILEAAEAAGLVAPLPGRAGRFAFVHALFRSHRYEALPLRRLLDLHAHAAAALVSAGGDGQLSERARHACLAVPVGDPKTAVELAYRAAHEAEHAYAYDEAAAHYARALVASRSLDPPDSLASLDLTVRLAGARHRAGDPAGLPMLLDAARRARDGGDTGALVRASMSLSHLGATSPFGRPDPEQISIVEDALVALGAEPTPARARLLIELAVQVGDTHVDRGIAMATEAESIARALDDPDVLAAVLLGVRHVGRHPRRLEAHLHRAIELERLGTTSRSLVPVLAGLNTQALLYLQRSELQAASERTDRFLRLLGDRSLPFHQLSARLLCAARAFLGGDLARAEELALDTVPYAVSIGHPRSSWAAPTLGCIRRLQDRDAELVEPLERIVSATGENATFRSLLAARQARSGSLDDARHSLRRLRADGFPIPEGYVWTLAMSELAEAADLTGDRATGAHVLVQCGPYAGLIVVPGQAVGRPVDQALAQAALATGDAAAAMTYADRAVIASRRNRAPAFLARELVFSAEARRRLGASSGEVRPLVREALAVADPIGARVVPVDVERYGLPT